MTFIEENKVENIWHYNFSKLPDGLRAFDISLIPFLPLRLNLQYY